MVCLFFSPLSTSNIQLILAQNSKLCVRTPEHPVAWRKLIERKQHFNELMSRKPQVGIWWCQNIPIHSKIMEGLFALKACSEDYMIEPLTGNTDPGALSLIFRLENWEKHRADSVKKFATTKAATNKIILSYPAQNTSTCQKDGCVF